MNDEEIDVLCNEILNLPKVEIPITATTQCEINVNDLFDTIRAFRKIPDYNELIKDNRKKDKEIEILNNIINELENFIKEDIINNLCEIENKRIGYGQTEVDKIWLHNLWGLKTHIINKCDEITKRK